ncbi:SsgA family sporulation/cell division regulator [Streptomyces sp. NPDC090106]|uniref:SsgA family sporulation/cell division regulator n=1 Tax=Streptomyces sp. NPDC090106 TaxID=3365946 RepID=UPI003806B1A9
MTAPRTAGDGARPPGDVVTLRLTADVMLGPDARVAVPAAFAYDPREPFAVRLRLPGTGDEEHNDWYFARDLLQEGLRRPAGAGDVLIRPTRRPTGGQDLALLLRTDEGAALLHLPAQPVRAWLVRTWEALPPGEEGTRLDWDEAASALLGHP